jgi:hypothetical protein
MEVEEMQAILEVDEAWSVMTLVVSQVLDKVSLSGDGRTAVRKWRQDRAEGTVEMDDLTTGINEVLGTTLDEKTTRLIRRKGYYVSSRDQS